MSRRELIRFVVHRRHQDSGERCGLFQAINERFASEERPEHLRPAILDLVTRFNKNLRSPFGSEENIRRSIIWWRAHQAAIMEEAGWLVDEIRTTNPGRVLYEDRFQVVAIPYADTPT